MRGHIIFDRIVEKRCRALPEGARPAGLGAGAVTSMIDTSNGLAMSLHDLADASRVGFMIYDGTLPIEDEVCTFTKSTDSALELAPHTGGDFGLLFTLRPDMITAARGVCDLSVIGDIVGGDEGVMVELASGSVEFIYRKGYEQLATTKWLRNL